MTHSPTEKDVIHSIRDHLPKLLRSDPSLRDYILTVVYEHSPSKIEVEDRFTRMLNELARDREAQNRKWEEQKKESDLKWKEQNRKWEEQNQKWEEQKAEDKRKWEEQKKENDLKWREQNRKWEEQKAEDRRAWEESNRRFDAMNKRIEHSIGALGSRWGIQAESAFRDALAAILVDSFGVEVINVNEFDDDGEVFGRPDQIELDIIIKNGLLIICEIKSSMSKSDMYTFERKVRFYERRHQRKANRIIVVSPMIDHRARPVGTQLGIEMYSDSFDVPVT
uniref:PD-(D/E)XK nuclease superfamily protein n=1 Tax=Candidatus Kentrum sp. MB TaxID=2138164 RepID=A0A451BC32_9GAMM|nr:MAG: hypothetical protein BECKMB1821I_GA0114274_10322 [Candidatus Kentron sp. MB]VFK75828.1 MAG: hypothetical protein BECKMB1821H_GA0114242_10332 [Candidatus Kentron sp. MB]